MWLALYQSASIWLVSGLVEEETHSVTRPQVQIGGRPIASRIAAAARTKTSGASHGRERVMGEG